MRVGVNLVPLIPGRVGGIKQLVLGQLDALLNADTETEYIYYINSHLSALFPANSNRIRVVICTWDNQIQERGEHGEFDVLYAPFMYLGVAKVSFPTISMVVDLQHNTYPQFFPESELSARRLNWEWAAKISQRVCTISSYVADTIEKDLGINRNRIIITPPPLSHHFLNEIDKKTEKDFNKSVGNHLPETFIYYPANTWPHKNHEKLLHALKKCADSGNNYFLVLSGWPSNAHSSIKKTIRQLNLQSKIVWSGYVPDQWMPLMYKRAHALVFPSLYEGFGIPLLEAMYSGCPVACSNVTSCPEVCGDAALYFDPESVDQIADSINEISLSNATRSRLIEAGFEQAKVYTRDDSVKQLHDAFSDAVNEYQNPYKWNQNYKSEINKTSLLDNSDNHPLVSIIVPSYNQGKYIKYTIDSILSQDYPSIEVLVIDGGSSDETIEILETYKDQISWISEQDNGQAHALNKGLKMARGDVIGWLNSDDTYLADAVEKAIYALNKQTGCSLVYGEAAYIDESGNKTGRYTTEPYSSKALLHHCIICQPTVFFKRQLLEKAGGANDEYDMALDYEMWLRYSKFTPLLYIPEELACSRMYPQNKTSLYRRKSIKEAMRACKTHYGRTSSSWCAQFAHAHAEHVPLLGRFKISRLPVQAILFSYAVVRNELIWLIVFNTGRIRRVMSRMLQ